jgi:hypothetical protein
MSATTGLDADKLLGLNEVMAILSAMLNTPRYSIADLKAPPAWTRRGCRRWHGGSRSSPAGRWTGPAFSRRA